MNHEHVICACIFTIVVLEGDEKKGVTYGTVVGEDVVSVVFLPRQPIG